MTRFLLKKRIFLEWGLILSLAIVLGHGNASATPQRLADVKATDCAACHKPDKVLPDQHPDVKAMNAKACAACHAPASGKTLRGKLPASHVHALNGITCAQCHKDKAMTPPKIDTCVSCHGDTVKLAEKTKDVKPANPHKSPHYETKLECTFCHHQHEKTEVFCNDCHKFDFKVP